MAPGKAVCVLTAAGSGTRLGADQSKALVTISGRSLLSWAVAGLEKTGRIGAVVVTAPPDDVEAFTREISRAKTSFPIWVTPGGQRRQESVANGLEALRRFCGEVGIPLDDLTPTLIHDAARPLTPPDLISALIDAVEGGRPAVIPGLPVTDTIKIVAAQDETGSEEALVVDTPPRVQLRSVQTPQAFHWELITRVHRQGQELDEQVAEALTDDAGLVELFGGDVWIIPGSTDGLKITTTGDLERAERIAGTLSF